MKHKKLFIQTFSLATVLFLGTASVQASWAPATGAFPDNNANAPIHVGAAPQQKLGPLVVNTSGAPIGFSVPLGKVGIGVPVAQSFPELLKVMGDVSFGNDDILDIYSPVNNVLGIQTVLDTTEANSAMDKTYGGNNAVLALQPANGLVGVGTVAPTAKLDIKGNIKINDGTAAVGSVLTAVDANGTAVWKAPAAGASPWTGDNNGPTTHTGDVGVTGKEIIAGNLWTTGGTVGNPGNGQTHFPYTDGKNYIRGTTIFDAGDVQLSGNLCLSGDCRNVWPTATAAGAQVNADWNAASGPAQILNKPAIPAPSRLSWIDGIGPDGGSRISIDAAATNNANNARVSYADNAGSASSATNCTNCIHSITPSQTYTANTAIDGNHWASSGLAGGISLGAHSMCYLVESGTVKQDAAGACSIYSGSGGWYLANVNASCRAQCLDWQ